MSVSNKRVADIVAPLDVLSEVITGVDPKFHDLCNKICRIIPFDLQVYIGDNDGASVARSGPHKGVWRYKFYWIS